MCLSSSATNLLLSLLNWISSLSFQSFPQCPYCLIASQPATGPWLRLISKQQDKTGRQAFSHQKQSTLPSPSSPHSKWGECHAAAASAAKVSLVCLPRPSFPSYKYKTYAAAALVIQRDKQQETSPLLLSSAVKLRDKKDWFCTSNSTSSSLSLQSTTRYTHICREEETCCKFISHAHYSHPHIDRLGSW